jgi:hypothetical protein
MTALLKEMNAMEGAITALSTHLIITTRRGCQKEKGEVFVLAPLHFSASRREPY